MSRAKFKTAFDVGANFGGWTEACLRAWPECSVHAFELAPRTVHALRARLDPARVRVNEIGLSDRCGIVQMYYYPDHPELTSELPRHELYAQTFTAHLVNGDEYATGHGLETIDFLKIDVEGAEFRVLEGMRERLKKRAIHTIQFDYGDFSTETRFMLHDCYRLLGADYWIGKISPDGVTFRDYHPSFEDFRSAHYCCVSKDRADLRDLLITG